MKSICAAAVAAAVVVTAFGHPALASPDPVAPLGGGGEHVRGELIVRYSAGTNRAERASVRAAADVAAVESLGLPATELVEIESGSVAAAVATLEAVPGVIYAEPNYLVEIAGVPNDPLFPEQWALHSPNDADVDAPQAWDLTTGGAGTTVAVVDTGVALEHPELLPNLWRNPGESGGGRETNGVDDDANGYVDDYQGWDWVGRDGRPSDLHGHGTHVAGTIGARGNDGAGVAGLSWQSSLMPLRALNSQGAGNMADLVRAFTYAAANGARVVNLSAGGDGYSLSLLNAITAAPDTLFVVAAGNAGANNDAGSSYPCNYPAPNIVCVGASDSNDQLASYSNYGAATVDLAAPGSAILSIQPSFSTRIDEPFETGLERWTTGGVNGTWSHDVAGGYAVDSAEGPHQNDADHWMRAATPLDLTGMKDCLLRYSLKLDAESGHDGLRTEASLDGSSWQTLGNWTGSSSGAWVNVTDPLFFFDERSAVHLRFRFVSDGAVAGDGASVDSVSVRCVSSTYSGSETMYAWGTSMAAPHVAGAAALAWSARPGASVSSVVGALLDGADDKPAFLGRTLSGGRLNACQTIALLIAAPETACADASASPGPTPSPSPVASPSPTATPTPLASPTVSPEAPATPSPSPQPQQQVEQEPTPAPDEPLSAPVVHDRRMRLRKSGGLALHGRVEVPDGFEACRANAVVKILRNGERIGKVVARANGRFELTGAEPGRYVAKVGRSDLGDGNHCAGARSKRRRL